MLADDKIQKLITEVQKRKGEIGKIENQTFKTNCQYQGPDGKIVNLQVINNVNQLMNILSFLHCLKGSWVVVSTFLRVTNPFEWQGYSYDQWANDIKNMVDKLSLNAKRKELGALETRLEKLISPELRAKMELELIEKELGL